jgi:GH43 family beta-xylosidase
MTIYLAILMITVSNVIPSLQNFIDQGNDVKRTFSNPVFDGADPWCIKKDGNYYYCFKSGNGIAVSKSGLLTKRGEIRKVWSAPSSGWNSSCVWAPELHFFYGRWYIYYAAGESGPPFIYQQTGVLQSLTDDPLGEYVDKGILYTGDNPDMKNDNRWAIDMTVFEYKNRLYAVWSGWVNKEITDKTSQHLYIAEMENPFTMKGLRTKISSPDQSWETGGPLDLEEGPEAIINNNNLFIIYSCRESWTTDYRLGMLKLKSSESSLLNPDNWEKSGPLFQGPFGTGHCSFTTSPDGTENWIIYHSKKSTTNGWERDVRLQSFKWNSKGYPEFGTPVKAGVEINRPSGEFEVENKINSQR